MVRFLFLNTPRVVRPQALTYGRHGLSKRCVCSVLERQTEVDCSAGRFPYDGEFKFNGKTIESRDILRLLDPFITDRRKNTIASVVSERTFNVVPVVEGLVDMGNVAAVFRSADAMGFGAIHRIQRRDQKYKASARCSAGSEKWLHHTTWYDTQECLSSLKQQGYQIVVTHMTKASVEIQNIDWTHPTAIVFGNELEGISKTAFEMADQCAIIPMVGFVESFNISVAAALTLYEARRSRISALGQHGDLTAKQQDTLKAMFYLKQQSSAKYYVEELLKR